MRLAALAIVAVVTAPAVAQRKAPRTPAPVDTQSISIGRTVVSRPFGAELVDRLSIVGSYRLHGRRVHLIRGDAAGSCPSRYVFATEQPGGSPILSSAFGLCSGATRVRPSTSVIDVAMPAPDGSVTHFAFDGTAVRTLDGTGAAAVDECTAPARIDPVAQAETVATFEQEYPEAFRRMGALRKAEIDPEEMRALVTTLACLAPLPAAERRVPDAATPLFASRHGAAAFAALTGIAEDPASSTHLRAAARAFSAEMKYRVERREPVLGLY